MGGRQEAAIKIACIQMQPVVGEKKRNLQTSLAMIEEAASQGARLIVLPELCNPATCSRAARKRSSWRSRCRSHVYAEMLGADARPSWY